MNISDIIPTDLQDYVVGPFIIEDYREQAPKRMKNNEYMLILAIYSSSILQDFESFLGTEIELVEDDIRLVLDEYISSFIT